MLLLFDLRVQKVMAFVTQDVNTPVLLEWAVTTKSDINPNCHTWKLRTLRNNLTKVLEFTWTKLFAAILHAIDSWTCSGPHRLTNECACWTLQFPLSLLLSPRLGKRAECLRRGHHSLSLSSLLPVQSWVVALLLPSCSTRMAGWLHLNEDDVPHF